jgi:hypothetical protein
MVFIHGTWERKIILATYPPRMTSGEQVWIWDERVCE